MSEIAPYGSWKSPVTADLIVAAAIRLSEPLVDAGSVYWIEGRANEKGRNVIVRRAPDGTISDVTPPEFNVRSRVHEYGGGAYYVSEGIVYFVNFSDQQIYRHLPGESPERLSSNANRRYADFVIDERRRRLITVYEDFERPNEEPHSGISVIQLDGSNLESNLIVGASFHAAPRISPGGQFISWMQWEHPNMPWDGTELGLSRFNDSGEIVEAFTIAGGKSESICQPEWAPNGVLYFVSDRTGWWNLYRYLNYDYISCFDENIEPLHPVEAEFGLPHWVFRQSTYCFIDPGRIICSYLVGGLSKLGILDTATHDWEEIDSPYTVISSLRASAGKAWFIAASPTRPAAVIELDLETRTFTELRRSSQIELDSGYISQPQSIEFPTENGLKAFAFYYPPTNRDFVAPEGELPPVIVESHGGPTAATFPVFSLSTLYWTSRGFGVLDVNYGGSTGYGRAYRERLKDNWGIVDVDDCVNGALYLVRQGLADSNRLAITGGSAGGYTTLCALTFRTVFKAGASHYGVSDLKALDEDTHKFESRYTFGLVPRDQYDARSPIHHTGRMHTPVIFFQGLDDKIVPPNQAEMMVTALREKRLPVAYVTFAGEGHGFRQGDNIKKALESELYFYSRVFGFALADSVGLVVIENLPD